MMATSSETQNCCLKSCRNKPITQDNARVEVKSFAPEKQQKSNLQADWEEDGEAVFHRECWRTLTSSAREGKPLKLSTKEVEMIKEAKKTAENYDSKSSVSKEAKRIAKILTTAKYAIAFTGAGISTAAGIGDFRGKAGKWTERDRKKEHGDKAAVSKKSKNKSRMYHQLRPTYTHEAISKLVEMGILKYVISQNVDGIHRLSGVPRDRISELHGNAFHEKCEDCKARYERTHAVGGKSTQVPPKPCKTCRINHRTGRKCERSGCKGYLMNTIINFGDNLESDVLGNAEKHASRNDAVLCLGTSLRVTPACDLVMEGSDPPCLVICNRQTTPFDEDCYVTTDKGEQVGSRVFTDCDQLMREVMSHILPADLLEEWEQARDTRMEEYDQQRTIPS